MTWGSTSEDDRIMYGEMRIGEIGEKFLWGGLIMLILGRMILYLLLIGIGFSCELVASIDCAVILLSLLAMIVGLIIFAFQGTIFKMLDEGDPDE